MSEPVIADFVGKFNAENTPRGEPVAGRILLSRKRLVLAADGDTRLQIPLSGIFDVAVGTVPEGLGEFFDSTVTIAFERGDRRYVAAVEADDDKIQKFSAVLFKAILHGTEMSVKHPARRGGLVVDGEFVAATLSIRSGVARLDTDDGSVDFALSRVIGFDRDTREIDGHLWPTIVLTHAQGETAVTTYLATRSARKLSILGRFLRLEYAEAVADLADVDLSTDEARLLVALYAGASDLGTVLSVEPDRLEELLADLAAQDLLDRSEDGPELTHVGKIAVTIHCRDEGA